MEKFQIKWHHPLIRNVLLSVCLLILNLVSATLCAENFQLQPLLDLAEHNKLGHNWLPPVTNLANQQQLYLASSEGKIFIFDGEEVIATPLLDLTKLINKVKLSAFSLHPSFALRDQPGANTLYTAHVEPLNLAARKSRLSADVQSDLFTHDAVITEWQLNVVNPAQIDVSSRREIIRIAIVEENKNINQLAFDPYSKTWSEEYGQLYFSLDNNEALKALPLYSGSVLRINPTKFGLRSFTVPTENPFIKNQEINDELVLIGAQDISNFTWSKKADKQILLSHDFNNQPLLTLAAFGADWRETSPGKVLWQSSTPLASMSNAYYRGRELAKLWGKMLFLANDNSQWQLSSLALDSQEKIGVGSRSTEWLINSNTLPTDHLVSLAITKNHRVLLIDQSQNVLYTVLPVSISAEKSLPIQSPTKNVQTKSSDPLSLLYWFMVGLVIVIALFVFKYRNSKQRPLNMLREQYANFQTDDTLSHVLLYKRHQATVEKSIAIEDLLVSEIFLNELLIGKIENSREHLFNEQADIALRQKFTTEYRDKMVDEKVRKITLAITDKQHHKHMICLYFREGNQRLTRNKYQAVIEVIIDWCWLFSATVNPNATPERRIKAIPVAASTSQAPAMPMQVKVLIPPAIPSDSNKNIPEINNTAEQENESISASRKKIDTELVSALEKLVSLKQQGFLSDEEFQLAKTNLLNDLSRP